MTNGAKLLSPREREGGTKKVTRRTHESSLHRMNRPFFEAKKNLRWGRGFSGAKNFNHAGLFVLLKS